MKHTPTPEEKRAILNAVFTPLDKPDSVAASTGSADEPIRKSFSQEELVAASKQWIREKYPAAEYDPDLRMQRLGLLIDFVTDLVPNSRNLELDKRTG